MSVEMKKLILPDKNGSEIEFEVVDDAARGRLDDHDGLINIKANESDLDSEINARIAADSMMSARMDTFTNLPSGSTSGDAELADVRAGANGATYANAGNAVRRQTGSLKELMYQGNIVLVSEDFEQGSMVTGTGFVKTGGDSKKYIAARIGLVKKGTAFEISSTNHAVAVGIFNDGNWNSSSQLITDVGFTAGTYKYIAPVDGYVVITVATAAAYAQRTNIAPSDYAETIKVTPITSDSLLSIDAEFYDGYIANNGSIGASASPYYQKYTNKIPVIYGDKIGIFLNFSQSRSIWLAYAKYDNDGNFIGRVVIKESVNLKYYSDYITIDNSNVAFVAFSFQGYQDYTFNAYKQRNQILQISNAIDDSQKALEIIKNDVYKELVFKSSAFKRGAYTRDGRFDATATSLLTSIDAIPTGYDTIKLLDGFLGCLAAFDDNDIFWGFNNSDYTLSGGTYVGAFYYADTIDIGYFQKAYPNLNFELTIKKTSGSTIVASDANDCVILTKQIADSNENVNSKINGLPPVFGMGYSRDNFIISIGHRGGSADYPENTLPNFIKAKQDGLSYVETDVAYTSDDVPVLMHDRTINRVARNADGTELAVSTYIANITYEQAMQYDYGLYKGEQFAGTKIMTFEDFILLCRNLSLTPFIELKRESTSDPDIHTQERIDNLISIVKRYGMIDHVEWGSFDTATVGRVVKREKNAAVGIAISQEEVNNSKLLELKIGTLKAFKTGGNWVHATVGTHYATQEVYDLLAENNIPLIEWYIDSTEAAVALADHKTTIGGMTNWAIDIGEAIKSSIMEG